MNGSEARRCEQPHSVVVGTGDSCFFQLPCPSAPLPKVTNGSKIAQISCGATAAVALVVHADPDDEPHQLLEWGTGLYGERLLPEVPLVGITGAATSDSAGAAAVLLNHPVVVSPWPSRVLGPLKAIRSIACGAHFVVAAIETGGCISWGGGRGSRALGRGGCGCGSCLSPSCSGGSIAATPASYAGEPDWVAEPLGSRGLSVTDLAAGDDHVVAICADGSVLAWGRGDCGQLGIGPPTVSGGDGACGPTRVQIPTPVNYSSPPSVATTPAVVAAAVNPSNEARRSKVARAAACGRDHSAILTGDGRLLTFGSGLHGQVRGLKRAFTLDAFLIMSGAMNAPHLSHVVTNCFLGGAETEPTQLGLGTLGKMAWVPTVVDALEGVGTMRMDGSFTGIASMACGAWHTAALSTTGDVYTWGWARFGALGPSPGDEPARQKADESEGTERDRTSSGKGNLTSSTEERAEVRPYPGSVEGVENLLLEGDRIVSVACGARYTLVLSLKKRAFVWGQVAPTADGGAAGFGPRCSRLFISNPPSYLCRSPRELRPSQLLRAAAVARSAKGSEAVRCCGNEQQKEGGGTFAVEEGGIVENEGSRWRVSTVGCGPWYIVFGIEKKAPEGHGG